MKKLQIFALSLAFGMLIQAKRSPKKVTRHKVCHTKCEKLEEGPVTVFIHGTVFPGISRLFNHKENRRGLYRYNPGAQVRGHERLGHALHNSKELARPFYKFYWSGDLTFRARQKAAENIFDILKRHKGPITVIAHSHGCNVALYLAQIAEGKHNNFSLDRLVLLAPPVQRATSHLSSSEVFKRVYSFYSTADLLQTADPQGLYPESKSSESFMSSFKKPFFSERTFNQSDNLIQARTLMNNQSPSHKDFITPKFFRKLPELLTLLDTAHEKEKHHVIVNIPSKRSPHLLERAHGYVPRRESHCSCHNSQKRYSA